MLGEKRHEQDPHCIEQVVLHRHGRRLYGSLHRTRSRRFMPACRFMFGGDEVGGVQNRIFHNGVSVQLDGFDAWADVVWGLDDDLVVGGAETVTQRETVPLRGHLADRWDADIVKALRDRCLSQPGVKRCGVSHLQRRSDRWRQLAETSLQHGAYRGT